MTRMFVVLLTFLLVTVPLELFAKADTCKITINGADLKGPPTRISWRTSMCGLVWELVRQARA